MAQARTISLSLSFFTFTMLCDYFKPVKCSIPYFLQKMSKILKIKNWIPVICADVCFHVTLNAPPWLWLQHECTCCLSCSYLLHRLMHWNNSNIWYWQKELSQNYNSIIIDLKYYSCEAQDALSVGKYWSCTYRMFVSASLPLSCTDYHKALP